MPDLLPIKFKASGSNSSDLYSYWSLNKTTQFGAAIITPDLNIQYGPTSETNYYNNYEVPDNGYVMMTSDSNGHYIYAATGDTQFIQISNNIFKQNFASIQASLGYVFSSTTFTVLNYNKPFIPYNYFSTADVSLGFHYEFGNTMCYPKTGINSFELDGGIAVPAVATNGPIFSATTGTSLGFFTLDGSNDYFNRGITLGPGSRTTNQIWLRPRYLSTKTSYEILNSTLRLLKTENNTVFMTKTTSDNNILFGGAITNINGTDGYLFKSNSGFTLSAGFTPPILNDGAIIYDFIESTTGKIYIGGSFDTVNGTPVGYGMARLNSGGTLDTTFNIGLGFSGLGYTAQVNSIVEDSSGDLYVGGNFNFFSGQSYNKLVKLNSSGGTVTSFNVGLGIRAGTASTSATFVLDLALSSDELRLYVGGEFTTYNSGTTNASRLVRILTSNGNIDSTFNMTTGVNNDVETILLDSSENIYIGGQFTSVLGTAQNRIARITSGGTRDVTFSGITTGFGGTVNRLKFNNAGKIIAGGAFNVYNGSSYNRLILLNTNGTIDTTLDTVAGFNSTVRDMVQLSNGSIIVAGLWTQYKSVTRPQIIRISSTGTFEASVTSLDGNISLQFQPYDNGIPGYSPLYLFSGTSYDYFGSIVFPNSATNRNNIFNKWYLLTKVSNGNSPPYDFYINGEKVFAYSGVSTYNMSTYNNFISSSTNAFLGDMAEVMAKPLSALTDNDVSTYFDVTKSRYGY
jgi:hypothetical protein